MPDPAELLTGKIHYRGEPGYEPLRLKPARAEVDWNARAVDRYPDAVVVACDDRDVVAAVRLARERGWKVKARSGGHSWVDSSVRDGGVLIDLSHMTEITVDVTERTAIVGPGVRSQELNPHLLPHGLYFPTGGCRDVGFGGFVLQGGFGFNTTEVGVAAMSVTAMDVVTADGELVRASDTDNPDLFWAARGSGSGFFGVVTRFHVRLHEMPTTIRARGFFYAPEDAGVIFRWLMELTEAGFPQGLQIGVFVLPKFAETVPGGAGAVVNVFGVAKASTEERALELLQVLDACPAAGRALLREPAVAAGPSSPGQGLTAVYPDGLHFVADNMWTDASADELVPHLEELVKTFPTPRSHLLFGPHTVHELPDFAFSMQGRYYLAVYGVAEDGDGVTDADLARWTTEQMRKLEPLSKGIQFADENLLCRPWPGMAAANSARLEELRAARDPGGVFHSYLLPPSVTGFPDAGGEA